MTKKQKFEKISFIKSVLKNKGWIEDRWGNFKRTVNGKDRRFKFQKTSLRYEYKYGSKWANMTSDYYKNVKIYEKDHIKGFQLNNVMVINR